MPELVEPPYRMRAPDAPIVLFDGEVEVEKDGKPHVARAVIEYHWRPAAGVQHKLTFKGGYPGELEKLRLKGRSVPIHGEGFARNTGSANTPAGLEVYYDGFLNQFSVGSDGDVDLVVFHLANYHMQMIPTKGVTLAWDDWQLDFENNVDRAALKSFFELRGPRNLVNYDCKLRRSDGKAFSPTSANDAMGALGVYFSALRGAECFPIFVCGYHGGKLVWARLSENRVDQWAPQDNWACVPEVYGPSTVSLIGPYWKARQGWSQLIARVVYWYDHAATIENLDTAIILAQVALEALVWHELDRTGAASTGSAAGKFEQLLTKFKIPTGIPNEVLGSASIAAWIKAGNIKSGPEVLTRVRNALVHSNDNKVAANLDPLSQQDLIVIKDLGLTYLELVLLAIFGHDGDYIDRFTGTKKRVPWKP